jgi:signal transduction histidine kinase
LTARAGVDLGAGLARTLAEAGKIFAEASVSIDAVLDTVVKMTAELIGQSCAISLISEDGKWLNLVAFHHTDPGSLRSIQDLLVRAPVPVGQSLTGGVAATGTPFFARDPSEIDLRACVSPQFYAFLERVAVTSIMIVPLRARGEIIGTLAMSRYQMGRSYTAEDLAFLEELSVRAALAISHARALERLQEELAERVRAEETLRRTEEQLRSAAKLEAIGRLAGGIAHDFNNILSVIVGTAELARQNLSDPISVGKDLEEIIRASELCSSLTHQLLAFGRRQVLQPRVLDLNVALSALGTLLKRMIPADIRIVTSLAEAPALVRADPGQLEQVVVNLAINGRDAMPGGGQLALETRMVVLDEGYTDEHATVIPGRYVMLTVGDTGQGMDVRTVARIFEPFFTTKERGKGTGLGLSTVYGIVKQSGGEIFVSSEPGRGTTFKVYFPAVDDAVEAAPEAPHSHPVAAGESPTVLLVDDDPAVRRVARRILELGGYGVVEAGSGAEATAACERHKGPIHLLLSDVVLEGESGPNLAARLTALRPFMKVLFMSGYAQHGKPALLGPDIRFLEKPLSSARLLHQVKLVLE